MRTAEPREWAERREHSAVAAAAVQGPPAEGAAAVQQPVEPEERWVTAPELAAGAGWVRRAVERRRVRVGAP
ncbi:MAG TPA: hypothetical protein VNL18_16945 [Gemmatimonadales bacterium]|nr:hypothetical protein [Gemmatimonadales bacterium]